MIALLCGLLVIAGVVVAIVVATHSKGNNNASSSPPSPGGGSGSGGGSTGTNSGSGSSAGSGGGDSGSTGCDLSSGTMLEAGSGKCLAAAGQGMTVQACDENNCNQRWQLVPVRSTDDVELSCAERSAAYMKNLGAGKCVAWTAGVDKGEDQYGSGTVDMVPCVPQSMTTQQDYRVDDRTHVRVFAHDDGTWWVVPRRRMDRNQELICPDDGLGFAIKTSQVYCLSRRGASCDQEGNNLWWCRCAGRDAGDGTLSGSWQQWQSSPKSPTPMAGTLWGKMKYGGGSQARAARRTRPKVAVKTRRTGGSRARARKPTPKRKRRPRP